MKILILVMIIVISGCSPSTVAKKSIVLSGPESLEKKSEKLQSIVNPVWITDLKRILINKYAESTKQNIDTSLDIRIQRTEMTPFNSEDATEVTVSLVCIYKSEDKSHANEAAETCAAEIKKELLAKRIEFES